MTDRDRLIDILMRNPGGAYTFEDFADYLLQNGVIVPPCKVGDTVYRIYTRSWIGEDKVSHFLMTECGLHYVDDKGRETSCDKFVKTVFPTREEAEKALKERGKP